MIVNFAFYQEIPYIKSPITRTAFSETDYKSVSFFNFHMFLKVIFKFKFKQIATIVIFALHTKPLITIIVKKNYTQKHKYENSNILLKSI